MEFDKKKLITQMDAQLKLQNHQQKLHELQMKERGLLLRMLSEETNKLRAESEYLKKKISKPVPSTERQERKVC